MGSKWKRRAMDRLEIIQNLRAQIDNQQAYEKTLQQTLRIAQKDAADARAWAERLERAAEHEARFRENYTQITTTQFDGDEAIAQRLKDSGKLGPHYPVRPEQFDGGGDAAD